MKRGRRWSSPSRLHSGGSGRHHAARLVALPRLAREVHRRRLGQRGRRQRRRVGHAHVRLPRAGEVALALLRDVGRAFAKQRSPAAPVGLGHGEPLLEDPTRRREGSAFALVDELGARREASQEPSDGAGRPGQGSTVRAREQGVQGVAPGAETRPTAMADAAPRGDSSCGRVIRLHSSKLAASRTVSARTTPPCRMTHRPRKAGRREPGAHDVVTAVGSLLLGLATAS